MLICDIVTEWWTLLQDGGWLNIWFSTSHHKQWRYDGILYLALNGNISHRLCSAIGALPRWRSSAASWPPQPPMFHFREKGFCWQKNPLSVIVMLIISYAKWAWQRQCSSRKDSCWREQPLKRLVVSEEAQRKWPPHWNPSVWPWALGCRWECSSRRRAPMRGGLPGRDVRWGFPPEFSSPFFDQVEDFQYLCYSPNI